MKSKTNNPNGRPKGTPNKVTGELRARIADFLDENFEVVKVEFQKLEGEKKIQYYIKLIEYVLPKNRTVESETPQPQIIRQLPDWMIQTIERS
jgi:hypothetical protein